VNRATGSRIISCFASIRGRGVTNTRRRDPDLGVCGARMQDPGAACIRAVC